MVPPGNLDYVGWIRDFHGPWKAVCSFVNEEEVRIMLEKNYWRALSTLVLPRGEYPLFKKDAKRK